MIIMTIQQCINRYGEEYADYKVQILYYALDICQYCGDTQKELDEEYCVRGYTVKDLQARNTPYHEDYDFIFESGFYEVEENHNEKLITIKTMHEYPVDRCSACTGDNERQEELKELTVKYLLDQEDYARLEKITEHRKKAGYCTSIEHTFETIMVTGSKFDIEKKFKIFEKERNRRK